MRARLQTQLVPEVAPVQVDLLVLGALVDSLALMEVEAREPAIGVLPDDGDIPLIPMVIFRISSPFISWKT